MVSGGQGMVKKELHRGPSLKKITGSLNLTFLIVCFYRLIEV